jgi:drug/metabolite transporter (DMT)-like permease
MAMIILIWGLGMPVFTIVLAWVFLGEAPSLLELAGMVLMLGGLLIVVLAPQSQATASVSQVPS